jgi:hypothetical protein
MAFAARGLVPPPAEHEASRRQLRDRKMKMGVRIKTRS